MIKNGSFQVSRIRSHKLFSRTKWKSLFNFWLRTFVISRYGMLLKSSLFVNACFNVISLCLDNFGCEMTCIVMSRYPSRKEKFTISQIKRDLKLGKCVWDLPPNYEWDVSITNPLREWVRANMWGSKKFALNQLFKNQCWVGLIVLQTFFSTFTLDIIIAYFDK